MMTRWFSCNNLMCVIFLFTFFPSSFVQFTLVLYIRYGILNKTSFFGNIKNSISTSARSGCVCFCFHFFFLCMHVRLACLASLACHHCTWMFQVLFVFLLSSQHYPHFLFTANTLSRVVDLTFFCIHSQSLAESQIAV